MKQSIKLGSIGGIAVGMNWSVAVILALFAWELGDYVLPARVGHATAADWIAGVVGAVVLLLSLLAHEVSHSLVARHNDVRVRSITLFAFGGISQLEGEAHTPGADFRIAAAGPAMSIALAVLFGAAETFVVVTVGHGLPAAVLSWLWEINLLLAIFNLIPAAPLDGGRILRAALWRQWGDHVRASVAASRTGRVFAVILIVFGGLAFVSTGSVLGLWPALIGLFVYSGARAEEQYALVQGALATLTVRQVMTPHPLVLPMASTAADAASHMWQRRSDAVALTDDSGQLAGVVTAQAVNAVPLDRRAATTLVQIAFPLSTIPVARPEEPMTALLERMVSKEGHPALVLDSANHLSGIVTTSDLQRAIEFGLGRQPQSNER